MAYKMNIEVDHQANVVRITMPDGSVVEQPIKIDGQGNDDVDNMLDEAMSALRGLIWQQ